MRVYICVQIYVYYDIGEIPYVYVCVHMKYFSKSKLFTSNSMYNSIQCIQICQIMCITKKDIIPKFRFEVCRFVAHYLISFVSVASSANGVSEIKACSNLRNFIFPL